MRWGPQLRRYTEELGSDRVLLNRMQRLMGYEGQDVKILIGIVLD